MILGNNTAKILQEASMLSLDRAYKVENDREIENEINSIGLLGLTEYTINMIPVYPYKVIEEAADKYIVYLSDISTYLESNDNVDIEDVINGICESNNVRVEDLYITVTESKASFLRSVRALPSNDQLGVCSMIKKIKSCGAKMVTVKSNEESCCSGKKEGCKSEGCGSKKEGRCNK